jgi:phosphate-selective porin
MAEHEEDEVAAKPVRAGAVLAGLLLLAAGISTKADAGGADLDGPPAESPQAAQAVAARAAQAGESDPGAAPATPGTQTGGDTVPLEAGYKNGLVLRSRDRKIELSLAGSVQLDGRFYTGDSVAPDSFDIRRARIDFNAKLYDFVAIRVQAALEDNPYIRNAYIDIRAAEALHVRIGQMKVPFSSQWLSMDNQVDFMERGAAEPIYPFYDRGLLIWGGLADRKLFYNLGVFTGAGVDLDTPKGDIDDHKDVAWRLFARPFRGGPTTLEGLVVALQGTYGLTSVPTRRYETRGMTAADYESLVWRWRTEQTIGSDGRDTDQIAGRVHSRTRWGAELDYTLGSFTVSAEWARVSYDGIQIFHDFFQGSTRLKHDLLLSADGDVRNTSVWVSYFLTGEKKVLDNFGWRQPQPNRAFGPGLAGHGAWEILARFSTTTTDQGLFDALRVHGFTASDFSGAAPPTPGAGSSVNASVLDGAPKLDEVTVGLNWTMNYNFRVLLDWTYLWAPDFENGKGGIVSGGNSELSDPALKNTMVEKEHMIAVRFICRI